MRNEIRIGGALAELRGLPENSIHCCVTSPPYWGLRDYGTRTWFGGDPACPHEDCVVHDPHHPGQVEQTKWKTAQAAGKGQTATTLSCTKCGAWHGQLGLEPTPEEYVKNIVDVFREVRNRLRPEGTLWLNLGDSYASQGGPRSSGANSCAVGRAAHTEGVWNTPHRPIAQGLKPKDLIGIPWRVAFALQADGWWLRSDIIWSKVNTMPESVADRPTKAHEYLFLLSKSQNYYYDGAAIREGCSSTSHGSPNVVPGYKDAFFRRVGGTPGKWTDEDKEKGRNARTVWTIPTQPYAKAHFAVFPKALPTKCIKAGTSQKGCCPSCGAPWKRILGEASDTQDDWIPTCECNSGEPIPCIVLDPFAGSGTTLAAAKYLDRDYIGIEINPEYEGLIRGRVLPAEDFQYRLSLLLTE